MTLPPGGDLDRPTAERLLAEIADLAASPQHVQAVHHWVEPELAFTELFGNSAHAAWLDAGLDAESGYSYLASLGTAGYVLTGDPGSGTVTVRHPESGRAEFSAGSILQALARAWTAGVPSADGFTLGWVGWLGYESGMRELGLDLPPGSAGRPDSALLFADRVVSFDHARRRVEVRTFAGRAANRQWAADTARRLQSLAGAALTGHTSPPPPPPSAPPLNTLVAQLRHSPAGYLDLIARCKQEIAAGEAYQLCLTNQITVYAQVDPRLLYRRLRRTNPTPRGGLLLVGPHALVSTSPELFLEVSGSGRITTRPIKGTRPRGEEPSEDQRLRQELRNSEKEQAENLMIVDLMRNDLSRVATPGSVQVPELFTVEGYRNVFQLVSTVQAQLAPERSALDALRSAFPAGSMTGAPKRRAMEILGRLEAGPRGAYAGAFGYFAVSGALQFSMTIRTVLLDRNLGTATIGTGGGITALSEPAAEAEEMLLKARPLLEALGAAPTPDQNGGGSGAVG